MAKGLLDFISTPEGQGLLSAAFGGLAGARRGQPLNSIGRAGLAGLSGYVDATDRVTQQDQLAKMNQMRDLQLKQAQQQMADAEARRKLAADSALTPNQVAMNANGGPTVAAGMAAPTTEPGYNWNRLATGLAGLGDFQGALAIQEALKKDKTYKLGKGERVLETGTNRVLVDTPQGGEDAPTSVREFQYAVANGYKGTYDQFKTLGPRITADAMAGFRAAQIDDINRTNDYNLPPPASGSGGGVSVTAPNGQVFVFPNQKAANNFKARAGIK